MGRTASRPAGPGKLIIARQIFTQKELLKVDEVDDGGLGARSDAASVIEDVSRPHGVDSVREENEVGWFFSSRLEFFAKCKTIQMDVAKNLVSLVKLQKPH